MIELTEYPNCENVRVFDIEAISLPVVYNKFGDHDPNGMIYVLKRIPSVFAEWRRSCLNSPCLNPMSGFARWLSARMSAIPFR